LMGANNCIDWLCYEICIFSFFSDTNIADSQTEPSGKPKSNWRYNQIMT